MKKAYRIPQRRERDLIAVLTAISRVSARMARTLAELKSNGVFYDNRTNDYKA
jgi:hypothetical protein